MISRDVNFLLPCPSTAIQGQVLFVALERINAGYIVQNAFILHTAVPFYYSDFYYISVLARGTRSGFGGGIAEGYRADSAQGFGQIPLAQ